MGPGELLKCLREGYRGPGGGEPLEAVLFPVSALLGNQSGQPPFLPSPTLSPGVRVEEVVAGIQQLGWATAGPWLETRCGGAGSPAEPSWAKRACVGVCGGTVCASMHECEQVSE